MSAPCSASRIATPKYSTSYRPRTCPENGQIGLLPSDLFEHATGLDAHAEATFNQDAYWGLLEELCDAYVNAFSEAAMHEVERLARAYVEDESTALGRLLCAVRMQSGLSYSEIRQAGEHGADAGWAGFTYTVDTVGFYDTHRDDVWELLSDHADDLGMSPLALLASFNRADDVSDTASFGNLLAWFALEEVGRYVSDADELVAYLRVSTETQLDGLGLDVQRKSIRQWARANRHRVVLWTSDEGVSGSNGLDTARAPGRTQRH